MIHLQSQLHYFDPSIRPVGHLPPEEEGILITIPVELGTRSYPIYIGQRLLTRPEILLRHITGKQVMIVTQANIPSTYLTVLQSILNQYQCDVFLLPDGEQHKNITYWQKIMDALLHHQHDRTTTLIALGGGVVGDITGFAAACYQRGVNYIQIPTTLIAQVDAAIGGKTAVNHAQGKNMIGAFYQPQCVISDIGTLTTLPSREYVAGLAEIIKYGLICDADFFAWLETHAADLLAKDPDTLLQAIYHSAQIKAAIVSQDEKENGQRALLNLGHTFGHAIEAACNYQGILHGEAVAIGILMAAELSAEFGWLARTDVARISNLLNVMSLGKQTYLPTPPQLMQWMQQDKKTCEGKIHFILLKAIGHAEKTSNVTTEQISRAIEQTSWAQVLRHQTTEISTAAPGVVA